MLESKLIQHAAPTLAGLKVANLLCLPKNVATVEAIRECQKKMRGKGISLLCLREQYDRILLYIFRPKRLMKWLEDAAVSDFLKRQGYEETSLSGALQTLRIHFQRQEGFPHEIGIFLGYPIEDVEGFIQHRGANCKYCGVWKVYGNVDEAKRLFQRYHKCQAVYERCYRAGFELPRLVVGI